VDEDGANIAAVFATLVQHHDLTWDFSDDAQARRRGQAELKTIREMARDLPKEDVTRIWNTMVDRSLIPEGRQGYYWRDPQESYDAVQRILRRADTDRDQTQELTHGRGYRR